MSIYFDNAATAPVRPRAASAAAQVMRDVFGNPSSLHGKGLEAELLLKDAREKIAAALGIGAEPDCVFLTSGGTESNNSVILGTARARARRGKRVITVKTEHPSVLESFNQLREEGFDTAFAEVDEEGRVDLEHLRSLINAETTLVSIHHVNNETGTVQPLAAIGAAVKEANPEAVFHADCIQSFCKHPIDIRAARLDAVSVSAHKIGGLKGVGAFYKAKNLRLIPLLYGGGQQSGVRPGTENTVGVAAFAAAAADAAGRRPSAWDNAREVKAVLLDIPRRIGGVHINGDADGSPYILNLSFDGIRSETLLHTLEERGIYASAGSACSSKAKASHVLLAMGLGTKRAESALRFSLSGDSTMSEAEIVAEELESIVPFLRKHGGLRR